MFSWFLELQIVGVCGGIPLLLEFTGYSLREKRAEEWGRRLMKCRDDQSFHGSDAEQLACLQNFLEFQFDEDNIKDFFMDLGSFTEDQRIPAAAFIDMWAELYELDEDGILAIANLHELTTLNLASLVLARYA